MLPPRHLVALAALGGAVGALARWATLDAFPAKTGTFPVTTLLINVAGAGALGLLVELGRGRPHGEHARVLLGTGVLGAFTTFSTFAVELARLLDSGHTGIALLYATSATIFGVAACTGGAAIVQRPPVLPDVGDEA